ncbi:MAG: hypothetical protein FK734_06355 [Asgard group archaeon]|nr:hypothetical protein [Asgard group archaeon]
MFDKLRRKATSAVRRAVGDAVEDEAERQVDRQVDKVRSDAQSRIDESMDAQVKAMKGMKVQKKVTGEMITDYDKFKKSWEKSADDPAQSVFHFLIACYNYTLDRKIGEAMATLLLSTKHNQKDNSALSGYRFGPTNKQLMNYLLENPNIAKSYLGANYKDDYKFDEKKPVMDLLTFQMEEEKHGKVFIQSGGKDFPTPVQVGLNNKGQWKIIEFSSIVTGCRKTSSEEGDF